MASGSEGSRRPRGPCAWCVSAVKWIPVIFIVTIIVWSYYAYVIQLCSLTVTDNVERVLYLIGYHILFAVFMWAYWQTIFTEIGRVPSKFKMPRAELERLEQAESEEAQRQILERFAQDLPITNRTVTGGCNMWHFMLLQTYIVCLCDCLVQWSSTLGISTPGAIRYCEKCQHVKPDRAHHCSVCGECVLKMDHHCPWVNNCVAFTNYKFFILFLGYALLYCLFIAFTTLSYFISFWKGDLQGIGRFHILFLFFIAVMFAVSLVSLFCYHCYLVLRNRSTLVWGTVWFSQFGPSISPAHTTPWAVHRQVWVMVLHSLNGVLMKILTHCLEHDSVGWRKLNLILLHSLLIIQHC
ncbi:palmitoyltransferase ZDHHC15-like isoform X6 [Zootermopsis nevadensis]|uniref:palmitoyltransferase ZDHHC15-like isoform X6 n=1 Tax=Zootermopsis nevadensis TaxID=136037 RepID=UPI000B8EDD7E|nr:palmitoyltransferase ZDHHC15-like isoform X6 [Zootermopsis nevadensis]